MRNYRYKPTELAVFQENLHIQIGAGPDVAG